MTTDVVLLWLNCACMKYPSYDPQKQGVPLNAPLPWNAPLVNFYYESVTCMKLTLVVHTSPIYLLQKAFYTGNKRKNAEGVLFK